MMMSLDSGVNGHFKVLADGQLKFLGLVDRARRNSALMISEMSLV